MKLADVALAAQTAEEDGHAEPSPYRAPEQLRDRQAADIRGDIYALGGVYFHMLTGKPPFEGPAPQEPAEPPDAPRSTPR